MYFAVLANSGLATAICFFLLSHVLFARLKNGTQIYVHFKKCCFWEERYLFEPEYDYTSTNPRPALATVDMEAPSFVLDSKEHHQVIEELLQRVMDDIPKDDEEEAEDDEGEAEGFTAETGNSNDAPPGPGPKPTYISYSTDEDVPFMNKDIIVLR
jgi:hypothetical protein